MVEPACCERPVGGASHLARELIVSVAAERSAVTDLYEHLIAPAETGGCDRCQIVVVVPHGALAYCHSQRSHIRPGRSSQFLVERYSIITVGSASGVAGPSGADDCAVATPAVILAPLSRELPLACHRGQRRRQSDGSRARGHGRLGHRAGTASRAVERFGRAHRHARHHERRESDVLESQRKTDTGIELAIREQWATRDVRSAGDGDRSRRIFLSGCETALGPAWSTS